MQVLGANVDVVFCVVALDQGLNARRLERMLALAHDAPARPVVVLTKADVAPDPDEDLAEACDLAPGTTVVVASGLTRLGVPHLRGLVDAGETVALLGVSGAGKSTLANALLDAEVQDTGGIRPRDRRGRHTTTARTLHPLPGGGVLLDVPGIREVGLPPASHRGLDAAFPEIAELAGSCRFADCSHGPEPGCAVTSAVAGGLIREDRLAAYVRLRDGRPPRTVRGRR